VERTQSVSATVKSIDHQKRLVELTDGKESTTIEVPPEVRNLAQLKVGDQVVVSYHEGLAAEFKKKGESKTIGVLDTTMGTARNPEGGQPGAAVGNRVRTTVVIQGVDQSTNSVTFTGPSGMTRTVEVKDPKAQKFIGGLKQGDEVELTYTEALAVTIDPK
jgi:Cu/Ag efflux protein CusF